MTTPKQQVIFLCGYANSGKTTLIKSLPPHVNIVSTSQTIDAFTARVINTIEPNPKLSQEEIISSLQKKENRGWFGLTDRELKIKMAEEVLVPTIGRVGLVQATIAGLSSTGVNVFESIGGEELELAVSAVNNLGLNWVCVNLRDPDEKPGVDIRELAKPVFNVRAWIRENRISSTTRSEGLARWI